MSEAHLPRIVYSLLLATGVLDWARRYPQLPTRMASHFGANGVPNNWQPKEAFLLTMAWMVAISFVVSFGVPRLITILPASMVNLPNREYWLVPEQREATARYLSVKMGWFGCALLFLLLFTAAQTFNANLPSPGRLDMHAMWLVLSGFLGFTGIWLVQLLRHFYHPRP